MQKFTLILSLLFCIFFSKKSTSQKLDLQVRYFEEIKGPYFRVDAEIPLSKKIVLCGGVSKDALQMLDITGKYHLFKHVQIEMGIGYHKQNNIHFIYGFSTEFETKRIYVDAYARGYTDHKSLYASEAEMFYKTKTKTWFGFMADWEYGKYFPKWSEVTKTTPLEKEQLFLFGFIGKYHASDKVHCNVFTMMGAQLINNETHPTYKVGLTLSINLKPEKHHH